MSIDIFLCVCFRAHWFVAFVYKAGEFDPLREQAARDAKAAKKNKRKPLKRKPLHVRTKHNNLNQNTQNASLI